MLNNDTICAISTPHGAGGIAVLRVSGCEAIDIVSRVWRGVNLSEAKSHTVHLGNLLDSDGEILDQCVATIFRGKASYTGEDTVEISVHGSPYIQQEALRALCAAGARMAEPGEFTRRAYASGRMDLAQAEAVADLIASQSRGAHRIAMTQMRGKFTQRLDQLRQQLIELASLLELELDFSEEDVEFASRQRLIQLAIAVSDEVSRLEKSFARGNAIKSGIPVAIVGPTNVGKSSLLNALIDDDRAIVSDIHGTTRDTIEDTALISDYMFRFIDTAGLRETDDIVESLGIDRSRQAIAKASIILRVIDSSRPETDIPLPLTNPLSSVITVYNKSDLTSPTPCGIKDDKCKCHPTTEQGKNLTRTESENSGHNVAIKPSEHNQIHVSSLTGDGIEALRQLLVDTARGDTTTDTLLITNERHRQALAQASQSISRVIDGLNQGISGDFIAQDLRDTLHHLGTITGAITTTDLLTSIFSRFCIGK